MNKYKYTGNDGDFISTKGGCVVSNGFTRIVHGGRGAYVEFTTDNIVNQTLTMRDSDTWRMQDKWLNRVYYLEWYTGDGVKVYLQLKEVDYADYKIGRYYVSPVYLNDFEVDNG